MFSFCKANQLIKINIGGYLMRKAHLFGIINLAVIIFVIGSYVIVAQSVVTGTWTANTKFDKENKTERENRPDKDPNRIHINFERVTERGKNQNGTVFEFGDLQGLSRAQTQNGRVSFSLVREAGTIECEGTFTDGKGSGTFRFTPSTSFMDAMRSRGFDFEKSTSKHSDNAGDRLFSAAMVNVTTALADDLRSANFGELDVDDLFKAAIFKIDGKFMAEMKATGFPNLGMEDLVKARIFKIDADYVRQVHEMGFANESFEGLVKFRIFKVTPEFLGQLRTDGFTDLSSEDIVKFRIFNIDSAFIREARTSEPNITVEQLVQRKIGVRRR